MSVFVADDARRDRRRRDDGRGRSGHAPERAAEGVHGRAQRRDARPAELAEKVEDDPVERASFDPFFTFFKGGVAAFDGETRVGAVGVSGLPGEVDEDLARRAIEAAGLRAG